MAGKQAKDPGLRTETSLVGNSVLLKAVGYVDLATAPLLDKAIDAAVDQAADSLIVDLTQIDFLGSGALSILAKAHSDLGPNATLTVIVNDISARALEITGLDKVFVLRRDLNSAIGA